MSKKVIVLGGSGMLGSMILDYLLQQRDLEVTATVRRRALATKLRQHFGGGRWSLFDADTRNLHDAVRVIDGHEWVINAIGVIKSLVHDDNAAEVERAIRVNSVLPYLISHRAEAIGAQVLQIATDCVYSGDTGSYSEHHQHDARDVYGKTKSLGEVRAPHVHNLRCSIVGPELMGHRSLLGWFLGQTHGATVNGFSDHKWNGITTLHFARICHSLITRDITMPGLQHIVPTGEVTKCELLECFARCYGRYDISVTPTSTAVAINRTLGTTNQALNQAIWKAAGYQRPPSVSEMVAELESYQRRSDMT